MIVIDASAVTAILLDAPEREGLQKAILDSERTLISAVSQADAAARVAFALESKDFTHLDRMLAVLDIHVTPFDAPQAKLAAKTFSAYGGKGEDGLSLEACCALALATARKAQLLTLAPGLSQAYGGASPVAIASPKSAEKGAEAAF